MIKMKIRLGVIMPHRRDRPDFLCQFHKYLSRQTFQPEIVEIVDYPPKGEDKDITERYRYGYDKLRGKGLDVIAMLEIDDFYSPRYLEVMINGWLEHGKPDIFGLNYTIYYHLKLKKSFTFEHKFRSSMMSTLIKPDLAFGWPPDNYPYTDAYLWMNIKNRVTFRPKEIICIGIKHGMGLTGGGWHSLDNPKEVKKYKENFDLKKFVGEEDFEFYEGLF